MWLGQWAIPLKLLSAPHAPSTEGNRGRKLASTEVALDRECPLSRRTLEIHSPPQQPEKCVRIGISGWTYAPWRGVFYPKELRHADELSFASKAFSTIELNGSFYSLQQPSSYTRWYEQTPAGFVFSVKGGRFITHMKRLTDAAVPLANFFASGVLCLREKLGPFLWQLPPTFRFDAARIRAFFELLPKTTHEAERLARKYDSWLSNRSAVEALHEAPLRHTLEVRHPSFLNPSYIELLQTYGIASCIADSAGLYPLIEDLTSDFVYVRLHGAKRLYTSGYSTQELSTWARRIRDWHYGTDPPPRDVYVYFDNDVKVRAPFDAQNLVRLTKGDRPKRLPRSLATVTEEPRTGGSAWRGF